MIATPSFDWRTRGASLAPARAFLPGRTRPPTSASPSPTSTRPKWARGARSPLAPSDPRDGIIGCTPRFKKSKRRVTSTRRTPDYPIASVFARRRIAARTSSRRRGGPRPIAWLRSRLSCNLRTSASEISTFARSPKPVLMPYASVPFATTFSSARARDGHDIVEVDGPAIDGAHGGPPRHPGSAINVFARDVSNKPYACPTVFAPWDVEETLGRDVPATSLELCALRGRRMAGLHRGSRVAARISRSPSAAREGLRRPLPDLRGGEIAPTPGGIRL